MPEFMINLAQKPLIDIMEDHSCTFNISISVFSVSLAALEQYVTNNLSLLSTIRQQA